MFKHAEGQKGVFTDKVWTAEGADGEHVSERKFVSEEGGAEELIIPGAGGSTEPSSEAAQPPQPPVETQETQIVV